MITLSLTDEQFAVLRCALDVTFSLVTGEAMQANIVATIADELLDSQDDVNALSKAMENVEANTSSDLIDAAAERVRDRAQSLMSPEMNGMAPSPPRIIQ